MRAEKRTTRDKILDCAEEAFAAHGYEAVSLREVTRKAGVNLAAVNYHFGSKEQMYCDIFLRRIRPINERRFQLLDEALVRFTTGVPVVVVLEAFIRPVFEQIRTERQSAHFLRILARNYHAQLPFMREVMSREFDPVVKRFLKELRAGLPSVSADELFWRFLFTSGAMLFIAAHFADLENVTHGQCCTGDIDAVVRRLVDFAAGGFSASIGQQAAPSTFG